MPETNIFTPSPEPEVHHEFRPKRPLIMGIVNVTPDSFSDGGAFVDPLMAIDHGRRLVDQGADLLDVGGESTRPGSLPVTASEQWSRIGRVVTELARQRVPVSVDTRSAEVALRALEAGAQILNDVSAGQFDAKLLPTVARHQATVVLMHMRGEPRSMQTHPHYEDCAQEVYDFLVSRAEAAVSAGVNAGSIWIDPGIGFGKSTDHNLELIRNLDRLVETGMPVLLGTSRKSFIDHVAPACVRERLAGSLASLVPAVAAGVHAVRVHDVAATYQFLELLARLR
jgi:dihydropteroate synthase